MFKGCCNDSLKCDCIIFWFKTNRLKKMGKYFYSRIKVSALRAEFPTDRQVINVRTGLKIRISFACMCRRSKFHNVKVFSG